MRREKVDVLCDTDCFVCVQGDGRTDDRADGRVTSWRVGDGRGHSGYRPHFHFLKLQGRHAICARGCVILSRVSRNLGQATRLISLPHSPPSSVPSDLPDLVLGALSVVGPRVPRVQAGGRYHRLLITAQVVGLAAIKEGRENYISFSGGKELTRSLIR